MKTETVTVYKSFDGKSFEDAAACRAHETAHLASRFVDLTAEQIAAAEDRSDPDLASAFETFGRQLALKRRAAGDLKRRKKGASVDANLAAAAAKGAAP